MCTQSEYIVTYFCDRTIIFQNYDEINMIIDFDEIAFSRNFSVVFFIFDA